MQLQRHTDKEYTRFVHMRLSTFTIIWFVLFSFFMHNCVLKITKKKKKTKKKNKEKYSFCMWLCLCIYQVCNAFKTFRVNVCVSVLKMFVRDSSTS